MFNGKVVDEGDAVAMDGSAHAVIIPPAGTGAVVDVATTEVLVGVLVLVYNVGMEVAGKVASEELMLK
jgi:hypothetical protein